jgi:hypothetical protein
MTVHCRRAERSESRPCTYLIYDIERAHSIENHWTAVIDAMFDDSRQLGNQPSHRKQISQIQVQLQSGHPKLPRQP